MLVALEVVESMLKNNTQNERPLEVVAFTNEEGARFTPQMLRSGAVTDQFSKDYIYNRLDKLGNSFKSELQRIDYCGDKKNRLDKCNISAFIEMHIEQGPVLEENNNDIGIVEGISGFSWMEITVTGESNILAPHLWNYGRIPW